ncbi:type II toxin-antitoxin system RelE/ParE family toxin [Herbaspirillum chlorophenolicum]|uniref:Type II toxin-antitoxin system RelE/ParE family toxin n=1 Tax=Herbaspirillum chlorophenolicum TaxID=211589 RepID=A0ABW8F561_9BURK
MILSFRCKDTEALFNGRNIARFANIRSTVERKLQMLDSATTLDFLRSPPGNRLEALVGDRTGQHSIRINDQYRICFAWNDQGPIGPTNVEIVDYH